MARKFYQNDRNGRKWSALLNIQQTATDFAKIDMTAQEHLLFTLPPVSLKQFEKFLHFSFKTGENFSNSKPRRRGQRKLGTPGQ